MSAVSKADKGGWERRRREGDVAMGWTESCLRESDV